MSNLLAGYSAPAQAAQLANAQTKRSNNNVAAITTDNPSTVPIQQDASPATKADLAKRMLAAHDFAVSRAKAKGALGGYADTWLQNELANSQAGRDIMTVNNAAEGRKALVGPESDLAAIEAYKPPSMWSALLSGLGSIGVAAGAKGGPFAGYNYPAPGSDFAPDLDYLDASLSEAAKAGVKSGLKFNPWTGSVF
jgi:glycine cleavage system pyridoxal-binding protein P